MTVADLQTVVADFVMVRGWQRFHTEKDLVLAMLSELAELGDLFKWRDEAEIQGFGNDRIAEELADVVIFAMSLANRRGIDLGAAVAEKIAANAEKYPVGDEPGGSMVGPASKLVG